MADPVEQFSNDVQQLGRTVVGIDNNDAGTFLGVVKHCAVLGGVPLGAAGGVAMAGVGSVAIPGIGAIPGWAAGALAGFVGGTAACIFAHRGVIHPAVQQILSSNNHSLHELRAETRRVVRLNSRKSSDGPSPTAIGVRG